MKKPILYVAALFVVVAIAGTWWTLYITPAHADSISEQLAAQNKADTDKGLAACIYRGKRLVSQQAAVDRCKKSLEAF